MEVQVQQKNISLDLDFNTINEQAKHAHIALAEKVQEKDSKAKTKAKAKAKAKPKHIHEKNFMLAMMEAVEKDQNSLSEQQITDANSTEEAVNLEADLYKVWMAALTEDADNINNYKKEAHDHHRDWSQELQILLKKYSVASAGAQSEETQQDGAVQADQGQTTSDATNLQMKAQMIQGINSVLSTLVNLLGRVTA